jgi:hypothetical protein
MHATCGGSHHSNAWFRESQARMFSGNKHIARQRHSKPATQGDAIDRCNTGLRDIGSL